MSCFRHISRLVVFWCVEREFEEGPARCKSRHKLSVVTSATSDTPAPPAKELRIMDAYPQELITHEAPLLVISGLGAPESYSEIPAYPLINAGPHIFSDLPPLTDEPAERLAEYFHKSDATGLWGKRPDRGAKAAQHPVFRIRLVGRVWSSLYRLLGDLASAN